MYKAHGGTVENITSTCIDISKYFIKGLTETFPEAAITFGQFHVIKLMNDVLANVWAIRSQDEQVKKAARTVKEHWNGILTTSKAS